MMYLRQNAVVKRFWQNGPSVNTVFVSRAYRVYTDMPVIRIYNIL